MEELIKKNLPAKPEKFDPLTLVHDPFILEFIVAKEDVIWQESEPNGEDLSGAGPEVCATCRTEMGFIGLRG